MCPARMRSAPASTSPARTWFRRATGFLRDRHGAPIRWWCSTTIWNAFASACRRRSSASASLLVRSPPDWWRHGRTERAEKPRRARELRLAAAVAEIPARDHELGRETLDQDRRAALNRVVVACAEMQVGQVEN